MVVKDGMKMDAAMQVAIIDFIQRTGGDRVHIINMMLDEDEVPAVVRYQAASALHLSANGFLDPENAQSIASTYVSILLQANDSSNSELTCSDDTCRLVILGRLQNLQSQHHCTILQSHKLLHLIAREDVGISVKTLLISTCVPGISGSHADESINTLISEVQKCHRRSSSAIDDFSKYRKVLLGALNLLAQRFPPSAHVLVTCCIEILYNIASNESSTKSNSRSIADNVIQCLRGLLLRLPALRPAAVAEIVRIMDSVADSHILASLIWMIGEFSKNSGMFMLPKYNPSTLSMKIVT